MKNLSLKIKLLSLSLFLVMISVIIGAVSYWSLGRVTKDYSNIADVSYPNTSNMLQIFSNYRSMRIEVAQLISPNVSAEAKNMNYAVLEENFKTDKETHEKYLAVEYLPGEEPLYLEFRKYIDEGKKEIEQIMQLYKENKTDPATIAIMNEIVNVKLEEQGKKAREALIALRKFHFNSVDVSKASARAVTTQTTQLMMFLILGLGAMGIAAAFIFSKALTNSLKAISDALDESSSQVSAAAGQIASSSEELSQAATEQAASLEETSASVEELSSMTAVNAVNAKKAMDNSLGSQKQAERGRQVVDEMVQSMSQINDSNNNIMNQINSSNEQMTEIIKVIQEIESKTKVINDIVFQTKLLSFNASVEAARAGEQGKGFAVVAEEVGNLAQMSGNAAKEISDMLASSIQKVEGIVNETKSKVEVLIADGKEKVNTGTRVAEECGTVLAEIVNNVSGVTSMAGEISNASMEQSKGIQEITKAMGLLDQVTQTNSATSEEAASAAEELSAQADSLKKQVLTLVAVINGSATPATDKVLINTQKPKKENVQVTPANNVIPLKKAEVKSPAPHSAPTSATPAAISPAVKQVAKTATKAPEKVLTKTVNKVDVKNVGKTAAKTPTPASDTSAAPKKASGANSVPSYDHPGFEDV